MRARRTLIAAFILSPAAVLAGFGSVVSSFRHQVGPPSIEGLAWDGKYLWLVGQPDKRAVCLTTTGSFVSSFVLGNVPYGYWHGITFDGQYLWTVWQEWPSQALKIIERWTTIGSYISRFETLYGSAGLAWDAPYLWVGTYKYTTSGSLVASFWSPVMNEPAYYGHKLWTGQRENPYIYAVTTSGSIVASFRDPGGGYAMGMTFDGQYLWHYSSGNGYCYQIDIDVVGVEPASFGKVKGLYR